MKRYQLYLDPNSISILDEFETHTSIPRSKLIREAIDRLAQNLSKIFVVKDIQTQKKLTFDSLIGIIQLNDQKPTSFALKDDSSYLND